MHFEYLKASCSFWLKAIVYLLLLTKEMVTCSVNSYLENVAVMTLRSGWWVVDLDPL